MSLRQEPAIEIDHAADEARREDADAAVIEQVDALRLPVAGVALREHRVVAQMRIAVDHRGAAERVPPGLEHRLRDAVADLDRRLLEGQDALAVEPAQRQQALGREVLVDRGHPHRCDVLEHGAVERGMLGLAGVVEFLANAGADLLGDLAGVDARNSSAGAGRRRPRAASGRPRPPIACPGIAACRRAASPSATWRGAPGRARRRRPGCRSKVSNRFCQPGPSSACMRRLTKAAPIGGASDLELLQLGGVFGRQQVGDGGEQLRDLHHRALQAAERLRQGRRVGGALLRRTGGRRPSARRRRRRWRRLGHSGWRVRRSGWLPDRSLTSAGFQPLPRPGGPARPRRARAGACCRWRPITGPVARRSGGARAPSGVEISPSPGAARAMGPWVAGAAPIDAAIGRVARTARSGADREDKMARPRPGPMQHPSPGACLDESSPTSV